MVNFPFTEYELNELASKNPDEVSPDLNARFDAYIESRHEIRLEVAAANEVAREAADGVSDGSGPNMVLPTVYLITRPTVNWDQLEAFLADEGAPAVPESIRAGDDESAAIAEAAARICYMSYGRGRRNIAAFVTNLLRSRDGSVFEHINYGFAFTGVSRSLTHELVRHRAGFAYSQRSQRYVDETGGNFVAPPALDVLADDEVSALLREALDNAAKSYDALVEKLGAIIPKERFMSATDHRKLVRQAARSVLPNAAETKIFVTANVRAWRHFIEMRASGYADEEIRRLALLVLDALRREAPLLFGDFVVEELPNGSKIATPQFSKI